MSLSVALLSRRRDGRNNPVGPAVLARWLGVTDKTVRQLAKAGIVVRAGRGLYKLEESVTGYCAHVRRTATSLARPDTVTLPLSSATVIGLRRKLERDPSAPRVIQTERLSGRCGRSRKATRVIV